MRAGRQVVDPERGEGQLVMYFFGKQDKNRRDVETYEIVGKKKTLLKLSIYKNEISDKHDK